MGSRLSALFTPRAVPASRAVPTPPDPPESCQGQKGRLLPHICQHSLPRTDLHLCLTNSAVDDLTGLPIGLCSLVLRYLLPECELERYLYCLISEAERGVNVATDIQVRHLLTGSSSEGLSVPTFCRRTVTPVESGRAVCDAPLSIPSPDTPPGEQTESPIVTKADTDCMFEMIFLPVSPERGSGRLYMDERGASHRGYVRVLWDPDWSPPPGDETAQEPSELLLRPLPSSDSSAAGSEAAFCLSSDAFMRIWHEYNQFSGTVERHGPAINSVQLLHGMPVDFDSVPTLPLTQPPPSLRAWLRRLGEHRAQWPPEDVRDSIATTAGGHLVATGHASSERRDLEWRLSFSVAEKRLSRTLTIAQRKVYLLVKLVQKCFLARPKVIVTYHLKTLMFWELEMTQHVWSEEHVFGRVLGLLDRIDACLAAHRVPSYFLPENNLISDCSAEDVAAVRQALGLVRRDPLRSLFAIDSTVRFEFSTTSPLLTFHAPLLEAITAGTSSAAAAAAAAATGLVRQARDGLIRDKHALARTSELLRDAFQLRQPAGVAAPRLDDWYLMTAAALCAATHRDEDVWVRDVLRTRVASAEDAPPLTERHVRLWEAICPSGVTLGQESPFLKLIRSCLHNCGDEVDRCTAEELFAEFIVSDRPRLPGEGIATLMSAEEGLEEAGDIPQTATDFRQAGAEGFQMGDGILTSNLPMGNSSLDQSRNETQREAVNEICSVLHRLEMDSFELNKPNRETIVKKLIEAGIPKSLAINVHYCFGDDLCSLKLAGWDEFGSAKADGDRRGDQVVHKFELIDSLEAGRQGLLDSDTYTEHANETNTALLDTLGYLLLNNHYTLANRAASWLDGLRSKPLHATPGACRVTFSLHRASRFLDCLPEGVRSLLLLSSCEVSLPVIGMLLTHTAFLLEAAAAEEVKESAEERVADLLAAWEGAVWCAEQPGLPDAALLSDAVVKLCLVRLAGGTAQQCADCLTEVEHQVGGEATRHVRRAIAEL